MLGEQDHGHPGWDRDCARLGPERYPNEGRGGVTFNWAHIQNAAAVMSPIMKVLTEGTWACAPFVDRDVLVSEARRLGPPTTEKWRDWALLRDVASLEIWMRAM